MSKKKTEIVGSGVRFTWYECQPGNPDTGGLGVRMSRHKKSRSFSVVLSDSDVRDLYGFLEKCLKKK